MLIDNFGGRKFVFAMFIVLCAFLLAALGKINYDQIMSILLWAFGIFATTNAFAHLSDK